MKRLWHAYGLTLCFLTVGLIWICSDVKLPHRNKFRSVFLRKSLFGHDNCTKSRVAYNRNDTYVDANQRDSTGTSTTATQFVYSTPAERSARQLSDAHIVVIVSYMRSGSTFTADILQHFPGTVYVFEPFHMVMVRTRQNRPLFYLNGTKRYLRNEDLTDDFLVEEMNKWFTCRYKELDVHSLADNFHTYFSRSMKKLIDCWRPKRHTLKSMRDCLPAAIKMCENSKQRLFKFIRLPMRLLQRVIGIYPNLQIVHLVRDPRGSLNSQVKVNKMDWSEVESAAKTRCTAISNDLNYTFSLVQHVPERIRILIYENLARSPIEMAKRLFTYLGLPSYDYALKYISKLTSEGRRDGNSYGIVRGNSSKTAFSWRESVNFTDVEVIDSQCQFVYNVFGYKNIASEDDLWNDAIPTHVSPADLPGLL